MEFARDLRRSKEIQTRKDRTSRNTPHGSKFPAAKKQLTYREDRAGAAAKKQLTYREDRAGAAAKKQLTYREGAGGHSSGASNFYGSSYSEERQGGLSSGATNFYGQQNSQSNLRQVLCCYSCLNYMCRFDTKAVL